MEEIPIHIQQRRGIACGMNLSFRLRIGNTSMLDILSPNPDTAAFIRTDGTIAQVLRFRAPIISDDEREPVLNLRARSLLSDATTTRITLDSISIGGIAVQHQTVSEYRSMGINYAGGSPCLIASPHLRHCAYNTYCA